MQIYAKTPVLILECRTCGHSYNVDSDYDLDGDWLCPACSYLRDMLRDKRPATATATSKPRLSLELFFIGLGLLLLAGMILVTKLLP